MIWIGIGFEVGTGLGDLRAPSGPSWIDLRFVAERIAREIEWVGKDVFPWDSRIPFGGLIGTERGFATVSFEGTHVVDRVFI
jgi:hypothetical protein